jgi:hypothetical protein
MKIEIRSETAADVPAIEAVTTSAFLNVPQTSHTERYIVNALRKAGLSRTELSPTTRPSMRASNSVSLLALLCVLAGCTRHKPVIYLDHEWSLYYAKNTCYLYLPQGDRDPGLEPCLNRQGHALQNFERALLSQLVAQPSCAGAVIANVADDQGPPSATGFWRLLISLDDSEGKREPWDLMSPQNPEIHHGAGDVREIARDVCALASDRAPRKR